MKTAYELAMERLEKESPSQPKLTEEQKQEIAEIDNQYQAKIAEAKILADQEKKQAGGDYQTAQAIENRLQEQIRQMEQERDEKKEKIRQAAGS